MPILVFMYDKYSTAGGSRLLECTNGSLRIENIEN